jgi:glycosyltransferase involved in cell wall biosynthesis
MWRMVLEDRLARAGELLETRVLPPLYRRTPIITLSESSRRELVDELHYRPERVLVVPPGIDPRFRPGPTPRSPHPLVVAVGRLMPPKRFDELIRIVAEVRRTVPDVELRIVGEGYEWSALHRLVDDLGLTGTVRFLGRLGDEELLELYRSAWVLASASIAEGWGMTITEAAACGTPAVASRITGHLDAVAHGTSGLLAADRRSFVAELTAVLTDPALRARLGRGAVAHAARFSWEATALRTFEPLAAQSRRHRRRRTP